MKTTRRGFLRGSIVTLLAAKLGIRPDVADAQEAPAPGALVVVELDGTPGGCLVPREYTDRIYDALGESVNLPIAGVITEWDVDGTMRETIVKRTAKMTDAQYTGNDGDVFVDDCGIRIDENGCETVLADVPDDIAPYSVDYYWNKRIELCGVWFIGDASISWMRDDDSGKVWCEVQIDAVSTYDSLHLFGLSLYQHWLTGDQVTFRIDCTPGSIYAGSGEMTHYERDLNMQDCDKCGIVNISLMCDDVTVEQTV